jgi:alpha-mannosidase
MEKMMNKKKLYLIGNAHIDPVWLWNWQEGFAEALATFDSALKRMDEFDDFIFTASSAAFYEWVEQVNPAMFARIQERVKEGRWELAGGWWIEPDCNIPSGESFARQALYGQRYFMQKFGRKARVGYNIDSFGHNGNLPQLFSKSGIDYYVFMRPHPHEKSLPNHAFYWEGPDGTRLLTFRILFGYNWSGKDLPETLQMTAAEFKEPLNELMFFYGVGNHGGGPTIENIRTIHALQKDDEYPELIFSTAARFFDTLRDQHLSLSTVHDDLQHHSSGCYAAHSGIKQWNRKAEHSLIAAEKLSTVASLWVNQPYPGNFEYAWKKVLFNQFHDILSGTSLPSAYKDVEIQMGEARSNAAANQTLALQALAWKINIPLEETVQPLVVFNPHAWSSVLNVELEMAGTPNETSLLLDEDGQIVDFQILQSETACNGRFRLNFAAYLPALGYRTYRWMKKSAETVQRSPSVTAHETALENDHFYLEIDPSSGCITSLFDKELQKNVFIGPAANPVIIEDDSDTWSHNTYIFDRVIGQFKPERIHLLSQGPVKSILRAEYRYQNSTLIQDFTVYKMMDRIDVRVVVDWHEHHKMLKIRFPMNLNNMKPVTEIPYGFIERKANGEEEPTQGWLDISGTLRGTNTPYGISILNNAKYSFDIQIRDVGLTVLRSPIYAHHMPYVPDDSLSYQYMDQGEQEFVYSILPHRGGLETADTVRQSWEINQPAVSLLTTFHEGSLAQKGSFIDVDSDHVIVSVLKKAEELDGIILRAYETAGASAMATITLPVIQRSLTASFNPHEIITFFIPSDASKPVVETNLLEEKTEA